MGKSWKDRPGKNWDNFKRQKHRKKEKSWNGKNHVDVRSERDYKKLESDGQFDY